MKIVAQALVGATKWRACLRCPLTVGVPPGGLYWWLWREGPRIAAGWGRLQGCSRTALRSSRSLRLASGVLARRRRRRRLRPSTSSFPLTPLPCPKRINVARFDNAEEA